MFDSQTRLAGDVADELEGFFDAARGTDKPWANGHLFESRIRRNIKLAEAPSFGQPILTYDPQSNGSADYAALAEEVEKTLGLAPVAPAADVRIDSTQGLRAATLAGRREPLVA